MTPELMKMNPIKPIIKVNTNENLIQRKGSQTQTNKNPPYQSKRVEEYSTFSDMSKQVSESDINVDDTQYPENPHTPETLQIHNTYNTTMHDKDDIIHDEYDTSQNQNITEIETYETYGEKIQEPEESVPTETSKVLTVFNKTIHHEDDSYCYKP